MMHQLRRNVAILPAALRGTLATRLRRSTFLRCASGQPLSDSDLGNPIGAAGARAAVLRIAQALDKDGDGYVSLAEVEAARALCKSAADVRSADPAAPKMMIDTVGELGWTRKGHSCPIRTDFTPGTNDALLVIDVQNDFCPGGSLACQDGERIIPIVNALIDKFPEDRVYYAQDWHPADHVSFASQHGKNPFEEVKVQFSTGKTVDQCLWPDHCVFDSKGAEYHKDLSLVAGGTIVKKGFWPDIDSYSIFYGNDRETTTGVRPLLEAKGIKRVFVCGIAYEFCVKFSALDAVDCGMQATVIRDACACVAMPGSIEAADKSYEKAGVDIFMASGHATGKGLHIAPSIALTAWALMALGDVDGDNKMSMDEFMILAEGYFSSRLKTQDKEETWAAVRESDILAFQKKWGVEFYVKDGEAKPNAG